MKIELINLTLLTFLLYLLIAGNTTYFLGRSLYYKGEYFLKSIFIDRIEIVQPVNKVLLVGFYLINIGFVLLFFTQQIHIPTLLFGLELLSKKLGVLYLVLGSMHMFNILVFMTIERKFYNHPKHQ